MTPFGAVETYSRTPRRLTWDHVSTWITGTVTCIRTVVSCSPLYFAGLLAFSCVQQICTTLVLTTLLFFLALCPHALAIVFHCAARFRATLYLAATRFCRTALRAALCCSPARTVRNFWCTYIFTSLVVRDMGHRSHSPKLASQHYSVGTRGF